LFTVISPPVNVQSLQIHAWPNSSSYTFFDGDELRIHLLSNQDCFFKVYHIDIENKVQLIYPNVMHRNNQLRANELRTIPDPGMMYRIQAPFGMDTIIVVASRQQFLNLEAEFAVVEQANQLMINNLLAGRGLGIVQTPRTQTVETVSTRFSYSSLPSSSRLRDPNF
jgi:hypothetical protein